MCEESRLLQVSGLGGWALINERENTGEDLGVGGKMDSCVSDWLVLWWAWDIHE